MSDEVFDVLPQTTAELAFVALVACRTHDFRVALRTFERVAALAAGLPARVDREGVYRALGDGAMLADHVEALDPEWLRDRDEVLTQAQATARRLRRVLSRRDLGHHAEGLERELARLADCGGSEDERSELSPSSGGRPRALWRDHVRTLLRRAHVSDEAAGPLLAAAGLAGVTPKARRKSKRRRA